jgi:hypothetical protein
MSTWERHNPNLATPGHICGISNSIPARDWRHPSLSTQKFVHCSGNGKSHNFISSHGSIVKTSGPWIPNPSPNFVEAVRWAGGPRGHCIIYMRIHPHPPIELKMHPYPTHTRGYGYGHPMPFSNVNM